MEKADLTSELGIIGGLHDVFNAMAADCAAPAVAALFKRMGGRFDLLASAALTGSFGYVGDKRATLQEAFDHVFQPMDDMYRLSQGNPVLRAVWDDARKVFDSVEEPVVAALTKSAIVAPDAGPAVTVMHPIKFRYRAQPVCV